METFYLTCSKYISGNKKKTTRNKQKGHTLMEQKAQ